MISVIKKNKKLILITWLFMVLIVAVVSVNHNKSELKVIDKVELTSGRRSYEKKEEGAWNLTKTAKWVEFRKARIEFNFDSIAKNYKEYQDILLVIDLSASMKGKKLERVKSDVKDLIESKLSENQNNRIGIITFSSRSEIASYLTNDKEELFEIIDNLIVYDGTQYYHALLNVENVLRKYTYNSDREFDVLFLTDGHPTDYKDHSGEYFALKENYPFINMIGIQYEMGDEIVEPLRLISDYQYFAHISDLKNILFDSVNTAQMFETVEIVDYINDDFKVESFEDIIPSIGSVNLENENGRQKVIWTIPRDTLKIGRNASLNIDVTLQESAYEKEYVITNEKEEITVKLFDEDAETQKTTIRPTLKYASKVIYNGNSPSDCEITNVPIVKYYGALEPVNIEDGAKCNEYNFKSWKTDRNIEFINEDTFIMPEKDVEFTGIWTKFSLSKSMNGEINKLTSGADFLISAMSDSDIIDYSGENYKQIFQFDHRETKQTPALTDYRYIGFSPNNYVYFNCSDDDILSTCEKWQIIGVFDTMRTDPTDSSKTITEKRIKLVRRFLLSSSSIYKWDNRTSEEYPNYDRGKNDWNGSLVNTYLNGEFYSSLSSTAKNQIDDAIYYLGGVENVGNAEELYFQERGTKVYNNTRPLNWEGKVGLMYSSDMYMVFGKGANDSCFNRVSYCGLGSLNWIYLTNKYNEDTSISSIFFITPTTSSYQVLTVDTTSRLYKGRLSSDFCNNQYSQSAIRPVVYLKSNIQIIGGTGYINDPYVLK